MNPKRYLGIILFLIFTVSFMMLPTCPIKASAIYTISTALEDIDIEETDTVPDAGLFKYNVSSVPTGRTVLSATVKLYIYSNFIDGDLTLYLLENQTWTDGYSALDPANDLRDMTRTQETDYTGHTSTGYNNFDVTTMFLDNYDSGYSNFSIWTEVTGASFVSDVRTGQAGSSTDMVISDAGKYVLVYSSENGSNNPQLVVVLSPESSGEWVIEYDFPTATDMTSTQIPEEYWNGTILLYRLFLYPYEDSTNVTIQAIPTSYSFVDIHPNVSDYTDTISSNGQIIFYDLNESTYEAYFGTGQDWHILHISLYAPDGLGLMWESFQVYINNTRVPYPPNFRIETGFHEYEVKDYFSQIVLTGNFSVYSSESEDVYQNWEVPLYKVAFLNKDVVPYNVEITRNAITRVWPSDSTDIRLYGLASELPYTIVIRNVNSGEIRDQYTLYMSNDPAQKLLDYEPEDPTPGGVAQVVKLLEPRDFILPAFFLLGGFALISTFTSRRSKKQQTRKEWRQAYLTHKGVTHSKQLSHYERRKFHEAEEHRFGKSRFRRRKTS